MDLATVRWPAVPRIGDTVILTGPQYGEMRPGESSIFDVVDVVWEADFDEAFSRDVEGDVRVVVQEHAPAFKQWCVCEPRRKPDPDDSKRCGDCGDKLL